MFSAGFLPNFLSVAQILSCALDASTSSRLFDGLAKTLLLSCSHATNTHLWPSEDAKGNLPVRSEQIAFLTLSARQMNANTLFVFVSVGGGNKSSVASQTLGSVMGVVAGAGLSVGSLCCALIRACSGH